MSELFALVYRRKGSNPVEGKDRGADVGGKQHDLMWSLWLHDVQGMEEAEHLKDTPGSLSSVVE